MKWISSYIYPPEGSEGSKGLHNTNCFTFSPPVTFHLEKWNSCISMANALPYKCVDTYDTDPK